MADKVNAEEMTPAEFRQAVAKRPVFILATGILEWHGDHLPVGTDALKMRGIAERLAKEAEAILLPQNWFGVVGFDEMLGTITFSKGLVKQILAEFFENLEKMGAKLIVLLTGHYGPYQVETIKEAAEEYMAHSEVRVIAQPEYEGVDFSQLPCEADHADKYETSLMMAFYPHLVQMDKWRPELAIPYEYEGVDFSQLPCEPDHADKYETSLMMAFYPHLVQMEKWRPELEIPYEYEPRENAWGYKSPRGSWRFSEDFREQASSELGERLVRAIVDHLKGRIEQELAQV